MNFICIFDKNMIKFSEKYTSGAKKGQIQHELHLPFSYFYISAFMPGNYFPNGFGIVLEGRFPFSTP